MGQKIRIMAVATLLKSNPQGITLNRIFFHMLTRRFILKRSLIYKDIKEMKRLGLDIRFEGNKIRRYPKNCIVKFSFTPPHYHKDNQHNDLLPQILLSIIVWLHK